MSSSVPMVDTGWNDPVFAQDRNYDSQQLPPLRSFKFVTPGLVATMGNTIVAGRDFTWTDLYERRTVAMVTENMARELWNDPPSAIGKRIRESTSGVWREVVGVVSDQRDDGVNKKAPTTAIWPSLMSDFVQEKTFIRRSMVYVIRSSRAGSSGFMNEVSQAIWAVNANVPLAQVRTVQDVYESSLSRTSFTLVMLGIAGGMALLLGVAGIYGVISYSVSQRTREIGIRIALGARNQEVTRMFVGHGLTLAAIGVGIGLTAAFAVTRLMSSLLFEVRPFDPITYVAVALTLTAATVVASYVPALRATSVDPVVALRAE
jgi:predicted permease